MPDRLFSGSWHAVWNIAIQRAIADVDQIDRRLFSDPQLGGALQNIVERYSAEIARLNTDPKAFTVDAFDEERVVNDDGGQRLVKIKRLRVSIPFSGEAQSLTFAPSRSMVPLHAAEIGKNSLIIVIKDDDNAEREVRTFCDQVQSNLDTLRQEYERDKPQLEQAVLQAADRHKAQIAAENERDSKRSFAVRR